MPLSLPLRPALLALALTTPFAAMAASPTPPAAGPSVQDISVIAGTCANCHGPNGQSTGGIPTLRGVGERHLLLRLQDLLMPLHIAIFLEPGLVGAKYALSRLGMCEETVRLPLTPLTAGTRARIDAAMAHAGLI